MSDDQRNPLEHPFRNQQILITGGAGFIGSHIAERLHQTARVRILDNTSCAQPPNLEGLDVELIRGSITNSDTVRTAMAGVDYIFHLAAMVSAAESMALPKECNAINAQGLLNVLDAAVEAGVKKLIFSSSAAIYGNNPEVPKRESMIPEPVSPYAITKLSGEHYCQFFMQERDLATASLRYFNVYGPRQDPKSAYAAAIPFFVQQALRHEPICIHGDGEQTRDFIHVSDVVNANLLAASSADISGVFNVGCGEQITVNQLAKEIIRLTNSRSEIRHGDPRPGDVKHSRADISRLTERRFQPEYTLAEGLASLISGHLAQR